MPGKTVIQLGERAWLACVIFQVIFVRFQARPVLPLPFA
jgi:hypothetical protein